jgi:hypothetical protein
MIQIFNITTGTPEEQLAAWSTVPGAASYAEPTNFYLEPGQYAYITQDALSNYHPGVKQRMSEFIALGVITVSEITSVHQYQDKGNNSQYPITDIVDAGLAQALDQAILVATDLDRVMTRHFDSVSIHGGVVGAIAAPVPTDLPTLTAWIGAAIAAYNAHRLSVGVPPAAHPIADTTNIPAAPGGGLPGAVAALRDLYRVYHSHKEWLQAPIVPISAIAILTY